MNTLVTLVLGLAASAHAAISASVMSPRGGDHVSGNAVTIAASVPNASLASADQILFQYRPSGSPLWFDVAGATGQSNPDPAPPFYVHWDLSGLAPGAYEIRAVASDGSGADPAPATVTVVVDASGYAINENRSGIAVVCDQKVTRTASSEIYNGDSLRPQLSHINFPAGALDAPEATLSMNSNPSGLVDPPPGTVFVGSLYFSLSTNQSCLCSGQAAVLTMSYLDADGNGVVDGTTTRASTLRLMRYDEIVGAWMKDFATSVDTAARSVSGLVSYPGYYALGAPPANGLARVYPVPFKPNGSNKDEGRPFAAADPDSGIVFDNVPQSTRVEIYTDGGARIWQMNVSSSGRLQWDAKNEQGQDVASGLYLAVITPPGEPAQRRKLLIVR